MKQLFNFHHIGLACSSMATEYDQLGALGYVAETQPISDPIQKVRVQFFIGGGPRIELVEPTSDNSPVHGWLKRGAKYYHLAYEVSDLEAEIERMEACGFHAVGTPAPAIAFGMRRIIFLLSPTRNLIELIEGEKQNPA
jgi:methylmalonyl-CoA/ethylmalonyl-CoA epimerase